MNAQVLAHKFFHQPESRGTYANLNCSFEYYRGKGTFNSYSTAIGEVRTDKAGAQVLVISDHNYSKTTAKHLNYLRHACPFEVVTVPVVARYSYYYYAADNYGFYEIKEALQNSLKLAANRARLQYLCTMFENYCKHFADMPAELVKLYKSAKVRAALNECKAAAEKLAARKAAAEARTPEEIEAAREKRAQALSRRVDRFMTGASSLDKLKIAYQTKLSRWAWGEDDFKKAVREYRKDLESTYSSTGRRFSYVWSVGDRCETSQRVTVPADRVAQLLRIWAAGRDIIGAKVGPYTITAKNEEFVQIGCHCIPVWNLKELHASLNH